MPSYTHVKESFLAVVGVMLLFVLGFFIRGDTPVLGTLMGFPETHADVVDGPPPIDIDIGCCPSGSSDGGSDGNW